MRAQTRIGEGERLRAARVRHKGEGEGRGQRTTGAATIERGATARAAERGASRLQLAARCFLASARRGVAFTCKTRQPKRLLHPSATATRLRLRQRPGQRPAHLLHVDCTRACQCQTHLAAAAAASGHATCYRKLIIGTTLLYLSKTSRVTRVAPRFEMARSSE